MAQRRRLSAWLVGLLVLAAVVGLAVQVGPLIWAMPERLHPPLAEAQLRGLTPDQRLQRQQEQRQLQNQVRTTLVQGLVGLLALTGAAIGASVAWRQLQENRRHQQQSEELTREGQITDRYTKAVEQLGSDKLDVRLGGIYALERIAKDSPPDRSTIAEVLSAYIRERVPWPPSRPGQYVEAAPLSDIPPLQARACDVQTAVTVVGKTQLWTDVEPLRLPSVDLRRADLRGADLRGADLQGANLQKANLEGANLREAHLGWGANLEGANLERANLQEVILGEANLQGANLQRADLRGAVLQKADLQGANLQGANLEGANLWMADLQRALLGPANLREANLREANLRGAILDRTDLRGANLREADLRRAILFGANLERADLDGANLEGAATRTMRKTVWPDGFDWKTAGVYVLMNDDGQPEG